MFSYDGLEKALTAKHKSRKDLTLELGLSSRTVAKISKGERLSKRSLQKIADYLGVPLEALAAELSCNRVLQTLRDEKSVKMPGGLYHELQIMMAFNSNHIEGSSLSEAQTRLIFETNTVDVGDGIPVDDILETVHHFRAVDYIIDNAEEVLSEELIKHLHYLLKHDTKDSTLSWFAVGDYKKRANVVGGRETARPSEVHDKMSALLDLYNSKTHANLEDIVAFHAEFEAIHPFQDGNGRVGRLIAFKECLRHDIIPFIIEDSKKGYYYRGLAEWPRERGWLLDTCRDGQDTFERLMAMLGIE